jgi:hypothetical protein
MGSPTFPCFLCDLKFRRQAKANLCNPCNLCALIYERQRIRISALFAISARHTSCEAAQGRRLPFLCFPCFLCEIIYERQRIRISALSAISARHTKKGQHPRASLLPLQRSADLGCLIFVDFVSTLFSVKQYYCLPLM